MALKTGDTITYCLVPDMRRYAAVVKSIHDAGIALRLEGPSPSALQKSQYIMISDASDDVDYYSEVIGREGDILLLKRMWTGKRDFFRVDSVFPLLYRKVDPDELRQECRLFTGYGGDIPDLEAPDETVSPRLWKMMVDINTKMSLVLEQLHLANAGLIGAKSVAVNISATGIRFAAEELFETGDELEVKMLLPTNPGIGVLAHGVVVRTEKTEDGKNETSLRFTDLVDDVRDVIIRYTLKRQRDVIRRYREQEHQAE